MHMPFFVVLFTCEFILMCIQICDWQTYISSTMHSFRTNKQTNKLATGDGQLFVWL